MTVEERFWRYVERTDSCWEWRGWCLPAGYGQIRLGGRGTKQVYVHRLSYEMHVGPIPEGLEIDHLCRNRACVNPAHLEPVTHAENRRRGRGVRYRQQDLGPQCRAGHARTLENTRLNSRGHRVCVLCRRDAVRRYQRRVAA